MGRPVVEHFNTNIFLNSVINGIDLFSTVDPDGDQIRFYNIEDYQSDPTGGFFRLNGIALENGSQFRVEASELQFLEYVSGSRIGWEGFRVIAVDVNGEFSTAADSGRLYTVRENVTRPTVENRPFSALANEATPVQPHIRAFDPDGYPIVQYFIRDRFVDNGFLTIDGEQVPQGEYRLVKTEDLDTVFYNTTDGPSSEPFDVFAYDGELWSERRTFDVTTVANVNRPVAQFTRGETQSFEIIDMAPLTNVTDDDGNSIKYYEFWNTSPHAIHGDLLLQGVVQPRKQWIRVEADELGDLEFRSPNRDFVQQIRYRGHDGKFQSNNGTISITTEFVFPPVQPELGNQGLVFDQQLVEYRITDLFQKVDTGKAHTKYQVFDANDFGQVSSRFEFDNDELAPLTIHEFTAAEADAFVRLRTGDYNNRSLDDIYVRAENEDGLWSDWSRLQVRTEPEYRTSTAPTSLWTQVPGLTRDSQGRIELSYSFMQDFPNYNTGEAVDDDPPANFSQFNQSQRISVRRAFDEIEKLTDLKFEEVSDLTTNVLGQRGGIYRFGNYGVEDSDAAAFAFFPSGAPEAGDSWYNRYALGTPIFDADGEIVAVLDPTLTPYSGAYTTLIHELMHNLGYNHVFDSSGGTGTLPPATNNDNFNVLSTFTGVRRDGLSPTTPQLYNVESIHIDYGVNTNFNPGDDVYGLADYWSENPAFTETLWDGGGIDTLTLEGSNPLIGQGADFTPNLYANKIDLSPGGFSTFNGFNENVSIAFRATIENAIGSDLDDTLLGNHVANQIIGGSGDDEIEGRAGDDTLTGGVGSDRFVFGVGDGNDVIDEQRGAGRDVIQLTQFPTLDSLEDDLRFTRSGNDIIIDLKLDNSDNSEGQIRIVEQMFGRNRIERLELNGTQIDLVNLSSQLTTASDQQFQITSETSAFGNLVAPI